MTTDTVIKLKTETSSKERYQQLLDFITIDLLNIEHQHPSSQYIITIQMTPIINSYFNKHPMSRQLIHFCLIHPSESVMKSIFCHQRLDSLPKHFPMKIKKSPCTISYTE